MNSALRGSHVVRGQRAGIARVIWAILFALVIVAYVPSLLDHVSRSDELFNDDVCQHIAPFVRGLDNGPADFIEGYCLATLPVGYRVLFSGLSPCLDPRVLAVSLTYLLFGVFLFLLGRAAWWAGGPGAALGVTALALSGQVFLNRMVGGNPRAFAFPLIAASCLSALKGSGCGLAICTCLGMLLYPVTAIPAALCLVLLLWVMPAADRGKARSWGVKKRLVVCAATGVVAVACVLPNVLALQPYGKMVGPADIADYPEAGPRGRFDEMDRMDFDRSAIPVIAWLAASTFLNDGSAWLPFMRFHERIPVAALIAAGMALLILIPGIPWAIATRPIARRLLAFAGAVLIAFCLARWMAPYAFLPQRYLMYSVPVLTVLWLVLAAAALPSIWAFLRRHRRGSGRKAGSVAVASACLLLFAVSGGDIDAGLGQTASVTRGHGLYSFAKGLPPDSVLAGWPHRMSPIPYLCGRPVLLSYETHLPFHAGYLDEMRVRMRTLLPALLAVDADALETLQREYGVSHVVFEKKQLQGRRPRYFAPFNEWIATVWNSRTKSGEWLQGTGAAVVFENRDVIVVSLDRRDEIREYPEDR